MIDKSARRDVNFGSNQIDNSAKDKFLKPGNLFRAGQIGFSGPEQDPVTPTSATM